MTATTTTTSRQSVVKIIISGQKIKRSRGPNLLDCSGTAAATAVRTTVTVRRCVCVPHVRGPAAHYTVLGATAAARAVLCCRCASQRVGSRDNAAASVANVGRFLRRRRGSGGRGVVGRGGGGSTLRRSGPTDDDSPPQPPVRTGPPFAFTEINNRPCVIASFRVYAVFVCV